MTPLRAAVLSLLPGAKGIFLRCDRGNALYVTNAPARTDEKTDWAGSGFEHRTEGKLIFLTPQAEWIDRIEQWLENRTDAQRLRKAVGHADFQEISREDLSLFIEGVKRLEMRGDAEEYEKRVRQRAAVCLREKRGGGTLRACALIADFLREGGNRNED